MRAGLGMGAILLLIASGACAAPCPTTTLTCGGVPQQVSTPTGNCSYSDCAGSGNASFDAVLGKVMAFAQGGACAGAGAAMVETDDDFQVTGLAPGTPLNFAAKLGLAIFICPGAVPGCCTGSASAFLRDDTGEVDNFSAHNAGASCVSLNTDLQITIHANAGEAFHIIYGTDAGGQKAASGNITGAVVFAGLPLGASVVSCRGFVQDFPVPAGSATWARIRALYRN